MEKQGRKNLIKQAGNVIAIIAMAFIAVRLYKYRSELQDIWNAKVLTVMLLAAVVCGALVIISAKCFHLLTLAVTGRDIKASLVIPLYVKSNLYKYLPGNIMHYVGRNQIAVESEATHPQIVLCTMTEMAVSCIAGLSAGLLLSFGFVRDWISRHDHRLLWLIVGAAVIVIAACIILMITDNKLSARIRQVINRRNLALITGILLYNIANQITQGLMFVALLKVMGAAIAPGSYLSVAGVYAFAWLIGFITPGSPGGLGVREAMLSVFLGSTVSPGLISAAAILNRIITITGDIIAFAAVSIFMRMRKSDTSS